MSQNSEELIAIKLRFNLIYNIIIIQNNSWNQTNSQEFDFLDKNNINQDYNNDYELFLSKKTDLNEFTLINSADHFSSNENREQEFFKNLNYFKNLDKIDSFIQEEDKYLLKLSCH